MITYLCGGINNLSDVECNAWRSVAKEFLKTETLDPMRRDYRGKEKDNWFDIVENDLNDIVNSDIILVNAMKPSWGTAMEVVYSHKYGKTVIAFVDDRISPWLRYHANYIFGSLMESIDFINENYCK